ncbi:MAG: hypothetical protein O3B04_10220 [Chloroflexi bacterium]|nr:hypothetical protein [Chloroflexota bacterium]
MIKSPKARPVDPEGHQLSTFDGFTHIWSADGKIRLGYWCQTCRRHWTILIEQPEWEKKNES